MKDVQIEVEAGPPMVIGSPRRAAWVRARLPLRPGVKLPPDGLKVVHLTDLHLRKPAPLLDWLVPRLRDARPDLILFTGDFCDDKLDPTAQVPCAAAFVERVAPTARLGCFGINGNHDGEFVVPRLEMAGLVPIDGLRVRAESEDVVVELIGLPGTFRGDWPKLDDADRDPTVPTIVLSHYPDEIRRLDRLSPDLYLAGHTHGGQICLPGSIPLITHDELPRSMSRGVHRFGESWLVVSRGLGTTRIPMRLFCPPEVIELRLMPASA